MRNLNLVLKQINRPLHPLLLAFLRLCLALAALKEHVKELAPAFRSGLWDPSILLAAQLDYSSSHLS